MLSGLVRHKGGDSVLPFVLQFYGSPVFLFVGGF